MKEILFILLGAVVLGLLSRDAKQKIANREKSTVVVHNPAKPGSAIYYGVFVSLLAFSPVIGIVLSSPLVSWGNGSNVLGPIILCSAVGVAASLPVSLGLARASGAGRYQQYWKYLESTMSRSRERIVRNWLTVLFGVVLIGAVVTIRG